MDNKAFSNSIARQVLLDYNQFQTTILTSQRGGGKTTLTQELRLLRPYFKNKRHFIIVRESQIEVDNALAGGFWDNTLTTLPEYAKHSYRIQGNQLIIDGEVAGVAVALTTFCNVRGSVFNFAVKEKIKGERAEELGQSLKNFDKLVEQSTANEIFFDEFEPLKPKMTGAARFNAFMHIAETYFRFRPGVHVTLAANLENAYSPFLAAFGFPDLKTLEYGLKKSYTKDKPYKPLAVWVHIKPNQDWAELRKNSYVGKISGNTEMFSTGGITKGADYKPTESKTRRSILYNLEVDGYKFTYWTDRKGKYFISERTKNKTFRTFTFKLNQCTPTVQLIPDVLKKQLLTAYKNNQVFFDSSKAFEEFVNIL